MAEDLTKAVIASGDGGNCALDPQLGTEQLMVLDAGPQRGLGMAKKRPPSLDARGTALQGWAPTGLPVRPPFGQQNQEFPISSWLAVPQVRIRQRPPAEKPSALFSARPGQDGEPLGWPSAGGHAGDPTGCHTQRPAKRVASKQRFFAFAVARHADRLSRICPGCSPPQWGTTGNNEEGPDGVKVRPPKDFGCNCCSAGKLRFSALPNPPLSAFRALHKPQGSYCSVAAVLQPLRFEGPKAASMDDPLQKVDRPHRLSVRRARPADESARTASGGTACTGRLARSGCFALRAGTHAVWGIQRRKQLLQGGGVHQFDQVESKAGLRGPPLVLILAPAGDRHQHHRLPHGHNGGTI